MNTPLRILHLEDDVTDAHLVAALLEQDGLDFTIRRVDTRGEFENALQTASFDLIISDFTLPSFDGLSALSYARAASPDATFIFFSGTIGEEIAVDSLKQGAVDYVLKDRMTRLPAAVRRAVSEAAERRARRDAERRLREQAALLDKTSDAILVRDLTGRITYWNKSAERVYGWAEVDAIGKDHAGLLGSIQGVDWMEAGEWSGEVRQKTQSGREIVVASRWTLLRDAAGVPTAVLEVNTDITEKKLFEAQLLRTQRLENLGSLAGGIAHDLNNMLSPIVMAAGLLESAPLDESAARMVSAIQTSAARGTALVRQILSFARGRSGAPVVLQIQHVVRDIIQLAQETFPRAVKIELRLAESLPTVLGDATQLHQVLLNLCVNARDAMPNGGLLTVEASPVFLQQHTTRLLDAPVSGSFLRLTVSDTGSGIPAEIMDRIFEPFFTTKGPEHGTGLGLSTVAGIVRNHGGFVDVSSQPGVGTSFHVYLPATIGMTADPALPTTPEVPMGRGERILLVEDERAVREMLKEILESSRYVVHVASDGAEALSLFRAHENEIDLVITDLGVPGIGGVELVPALVRANPAIRVICITGDSEETFADSGIRPLVREIIAKPFTSERLLLGIQQALATSSSDGAE